MPRRSLLREGVLALLVASAAVALGISTLIPRAAQSENLMCNGNDLHRTSDNTTVQDLNHVLPDGGSFSPFNRTLAYQGVQSAIAEINSKTNFEFQEVGGSPPGVDTWSRISLFFSGKVGATLFNGWPSFTQPTPCSQFPNQEIQEAEYYYSFNHGWTGADDYKCVAVHEFLHGLGLDHNNLSGSVLRFVPNSFSHTDRCHGSSPAVSLSAQDVADVDDLAQYY